MPNYNPCLGAERCSAISEKSPCSLGYVLHPAVFDGTIHSLGTASVGKNVNDLKIFGGVGRVSIIQTENFSQHEAWLFHRCAFQTRLIKCSFPFHCFATGRSSSSGDFNGVLNGPMIQSFNHFCPGSPAIWETQLEGLATGSGDVGTKEEYWIWLSIKEKLEASETFDLKACHLGCWLFLCR